ncbi:MAG: class I SAM-dependent methyltransferase [Terrimicrobiaceae bacterium]
MPSGGIGIATLLQFLPHEQLVGEEKCRDALAQEEFSLQSVFPGNSGSHIFRSMGTFEDHFCSHAEGYPAYRPTYPAALIDFLVSCAHGSQLALDCGCVTKTKLSVLLAGRFDRVDATDASASQIENAKAHPRVEYRVAPAERSGLPDAAVDLVTLALAAHWFDLPRFYAEVRRVGRPRTSIALISSGFCMSTGSPMRSRSDFIGTCLAPSGQPSAAMWRTDIARSRFRLPRLKLPPCRWKFPGIFPISLVTSIHGQP